MKQEKINQKDSEGREYGLWQSYWSNGKLWINGKYVQGEQKGLHLWYNEDGSLYRKKYYI